MHYQFCPICGQHLDAHPLGDDGLVPWCTACERPWFDSFSTCIIAAVSNAQGQLLLQREKRRPEREVLVAGYMQPGESAEEAVRREIIEETGMQPHALRYVGSRPYLGGEQLMLGFLATAEGVPHGTNEILSARWTTPAEAVACLRPGSMAQALAEVLLKESEGEGK